MTTLTTERDNSIGFGIADMAYILQLQDTAAAKASARWLRLSDESANPDFIRAGLSSLIARGLATVSGNSQVSFDQRLDIVAYTVANARRWTQVDLLQSAELGDSVLHVESDRTKLLLQPRTMQTWFTLPQEPAVSAEAAESYLVREHLNTHPDGGVRLRTSGPAGDFQMLVRKDSAGWICALAVDDEVGPETAPLSDDELLSALSTFRTGSPLARG